MHSFMSTPQLVSEVGTLVAMETERKRLEEILSEDPQLEVCCYIHLVLCYSSAWHGRLMCSLID